MCLDSGGRNRCLDLLMPLLQHGVELLSAEESVATRSIVGVTAATVKLRCRNEAKVTDRLPLRRHDVVVIQKPGVHRAIVVDADQAGALRVFYPIRE